MIRLSFTRNLEQTFSHRPSHIIAKFQEEHVTCYTLNTLKNENNFKLQNCNLGQFLSSKRVSVKLTEVDNIFRPPRNDLSELNKKNCINNK